MTNSAFKKQQGVGLIEVLVTLLILSTSLLAMGALQTRSLQFNHSAYLRSQANIMAYDVLDRMRINRENYTEYERAFEAAAPSGSSLAATDMAAWLDIVSTTLPGGDAAIECDADLLCSVSVRWIEQADEAGAAYDPAAPETATFTYTTRI